jgi:hypothetical protein
MSKGYQIEKMIEAGRRVRESGILLSVTVLLGIAGLGRGPEHAEATGRALTAIDPDYAGALTLMIVPNTPLWDLMQEGKFDLPGPFDLLAELYIMLKHTKMSSGLFMSNHASNYVPLRVNMPMQKAAALSSLRQIIDSKDRSKLRPEYSRAL